MTNPIDLSQFHENNDPNQPLKPRPSFRPWEDVYRCIALQQGRNNGVIDALITEAIATELWSYFDDARQYNRQLSATLDHNHNLSVTGDDDQGQPFYDASQPLPFQPDPPAPTSLDAWKTNHYSLLRRAAYDSTGDQLDRLTKALKYLSDNGLDIGPDGEAQLIMAFGEGGVKTRHPKPDDTVRNTDGD